MWRPPAARARCRSTERDLARALGARVAALAARLKRTRLNAGRARLATLWLWGAVDVELVVVVRGGLPLADLRAGRSAAARAAARAWCAAAATPTRGPRCSPCPISIFTITELLANPAARWVASLSLLAGLRVVLRYGFVSACFSSASRMKGMVRRRCAANDASSSSSRILKSECRSRGMRFIKYSKVSAGSCRPRCAARS